MSADFLGSNPELLENFVNTFASSFFGHYDIAGRINFLYAENYDIKNAKVFNQHIEIGNDRKCIWIKDISGDFGDYAFVVLKNMQIRSNDNSEYFAIRIFADLDEPKSFNESKVKSFEEVIGKQTSFQTNGDRVIYNHYWDESYDFWEFEHFDNKITFENCCGPWNIKATKHIGQCIYWTSNMLGYNQNDYKTN